MYQCVLCNKEAHGNVNPKADAVICYPCVQRLLNTPQDKLKSTHSALIAKGFHEKASIIDKWIITEEEIDGETNRPMDRSRVSRKARAAV